MVFKASYGSGYRPGDDGDAGDDDQKDIMAIRQRWPI